MTAEVVIMNTQGIALAADSAVTLGGSGKIYNTADKLFALSKYHPVGILIYGSASIMGIEWETIIKCYRDFLGSKSFGKLSDYRKDFLNYLAKFPNFRTEQMVDYLKSMCYEVFSNILEWFLDDLHSEFDGMETIKLSQINTAFDTSLKNIKNKMRKTNDEKHLKPDYNFIDLNYKATNEMLKIIFEKYKLSQKQIAMIINILKMNFLKCCWNDDYTGIVIAGYGEKDIFPVLCDFRVGGKLGNSLIYFGNDENQIDINNTASICPFSQTEMVHQFIRGVDPDFFEYTIEKLDTILKKLSPLMNDPDNEKPGAISKLFNDHLNKIMRNVYIDPIINIVEHMQKNELLSMAEAMVSITALKRHVSSDQESVGGPIDVALITKNDGFIWIKKKTNYDPNLNRELMQSYFRAGKNEYI